MQCKATTCGAVYETHFEQFWHGQCGVRPHLLWRSVGAQVPHQLDDRNQVGDGMPYLEHMIPRRLKTTASRLRQRLFWQYRRVNWRRRVLPDFILIGTMKAGTSSLFSYLSQHPELVPSCTKEIHFFDGGLKPEIDSFEKGQAWYRSHFPAQDKVDTGSRAFEASPLYIFNPLVPKRIFELIPGVKLIALLRNPTERAISHYFHEKRKGRENLSIDEALREEEERLKHVIRVGDYKSRIFIDYSYKSRGLYGEQIQRYMNYFPWKNILTISSEELFSEPDHVLRRVFEFVGVDAGCKIENLSPRNVASNRSEVDPHVYEYLDNYFRPHNQMLYELVGKSFGW